MEKPKSDGSVTIHLFHGHEPLHYDFNEAQSHGPGSLGQVYCIYLEKGRLEIPISSIAYIEIEYTSQEFRDAIKQWADEAHPEHEATDNLDRSCYKCQEILIARAQIEMLGGPRG